MFLQAKCNKEVLMLETVSRTRNAWIRYMSESNYMYIHVVIILKIV